MAEKAGRRALARARWLAVEFMRDLLKKLFSFKGKTLVSFHSIGDLDAVASALVLENVLQQKRVDCEVKALDSINSASKTVLKKLWLPEIEKAGALDYDNIILVDVSNPDLLGEKADEIARFKGTLVAVDHHYHSNHLRNAYLFVNQKSSSVSEIIYAMSKLTRVKLSRKHALLLLAGILSDTAFFKSAKNETFKAVSELLDLGGANFREVVELTETRPGLSEKTAVLKCVSQARFERFRESIIALGESPCYELGCASALVCIGADFAFVSNPKEARISAAKAVSAKGNVGKIMEAVGKSFGGSGGGHEAVGGAKGRKERLSNALGECVRLAKKNL